MHLRRIRRHTHVRPVGRLVGHHLAAHTGHRGIYELIASLLSDTSMWGYWAHSIWLNLGRGERHRRWLRTVHELSYATGRRVYSRGGMGELHVLPFKVRWTALGMMRLHIWVPRRMLWCRTLGLGWTPLQMHRELVMVSSHMAVADHIGRRGDQWGSWAAFKHGDVALIIV